MLAKRDRCEANERFDDQRPFSGSKYENWFELNGIAKALCDDLSTRRKSILEQVAVSGANSSSNAARQLANLKTRQEKDNNVTTEELEESWNKIAVSHGLTPDKVKKLMGQTCEINLVESLSTAVEAALEKITSSSSTFDRLLLMRHVSEELQALPIGSDLIREHVSEELRHSPQIVQLCEGDNPLYTTKQMWDIEQWFVEQCKV
jgi:DNA-directed RNA polymerase sigma subunit (sigma70/sigma32)